MITSIEINGLRGIKEGELPDFTPLVVFVGPNGSGKSTILDTLLIAGGRKPADAVGFAVRRHSGVNLAARWLLYRGGADGEAQVFLSTEKGARRATLSLN